MNKFILAILLSLNLFNINAIAQNAQKAMTDAQKSAYVDFQTNADIIRLNHLVYWGKLIDEYRQKWDIILLLINQNTPFMWRLPRHYSKVSLTVINRLHLQQ